MQKLLRLTIYLMVLFIISVVYYTYIWWSFKPLKNLDIANSIQIPPKLL